MANFFMGVNIENEVIYKTQAGPIEIEIGIEKEASRLAKMTLKCLPPLNWIDYDFDFDPDAA